MSTPPPYITFDEIRRMLEGPVDNSPASMEQKQRLDQLLNDQESSQRANRDQSRSIQNQRDLRFREQRALQRLRARGVIGPSSGPGTSGQAAPTTPPSGSSVGTPVRTAPSALRLDSYVNRTTAIIGILSAAKPLIDQSPSLASWLLSAPRITADLISGKPLANSDLELIEKVFLYAPEARDIILDLDGRNRHGAEPQEAPPPGAPPQGGAPGGTAPNGRAPGPGSTPPGPSAPPGPGPGSTPPGPGAPPGPYRRSGPGAPPSPGPGGTPAPGPGAPPGPGSAPGGRLPDGYSPPGPFPGGAPRPGGAPLAPPAPPVPGPGGGDLQGGLPNRPQPVIVAWNLRFSGSLKRIVNSDSFVTDILRVPRLGRLYFTKEFEEYDTVTVAGRRIEYQSFRLGRGYEWIDNSGRLQRRQYIGGFTPDRTFVDGGVRFQEVETDLQIVEQVPEYAVGGLAQPAVHPGAKPGGTPDTQPRPPGTDPGSPPPEPDRRAPPLPFPGSTPQPQPGSVPGGAPGPQPRPNPQPRPTPGPRPGEAPEPGPQPRPGESPNAPPAGDPGGAPKPGTPPGTTPGGIPGTAPSNPDTSNASNPLAPLAPAFPFIPVFGPAGRSNPGTGNAPGTTPQPQPQPITPPSTGTPQPPSSPTCFYDNRNISSGVTSANRKLDSLGTVLETIQTVQLLGLQQTSNTINNKLGDQLPNGGVGGFLKRFWDRFNISKILEVLTFITVLHNAYMLSNALTQTLFSAFDNILELFGVDLKNSEGQEIDVNQWVGRQVEAFFESMFGVETVDGIQDAWKRWNRIYQAAANIVFSIQSIGYSILEALEVVGNYVAKIGNAARKAGTVLENAYGWMNPNLNFMNGRFFGWINGTQEVVEAVDNVASEALNIKETVSELKKQSTELSNAVGIGEEKEEIRETQQKNNAQAPEISPDQERRADD